MLTSKLSTKGQVTLPKSVRDSIGAKPGDWIAYDVQGSRVTLSRVEPLNLPFHTALAQSFDEWSTPEDEFAFRNL